MHHPSMLGFIATALAGSALAVPFHDENDAHLAPLITPTAPPMGGPLSHLSIQGGRSPSDYLIRDNYIVVFKKGTSEHHTKHKEKVHKLWKRDQQQRIQSDSYGPTDLFSGIRHHFGIGEDSVDSFKGYSIHVPQALISIIRSFPEVDYVERDSRVWINEHYDNPSTIPVAEKSAHSTSEPIDVEYGAPWGLARISHRHKLKFSTFNVYPFEDPAGLGVDAYVIDTGVNIEHEDLEGRAIWGKTIPDDPDKDLNGHGSHVAGTIAGRTYGVAKNATIIAVKVLGAGGSGTMSDVVAGVVWAAEAAATKARDEAAKKGSKHKGSVANMSLGGGNSPSLDQAVNAAVDTGLHFAVAAGNDNKDACTFSPAAAKKPITVGASTIQDERAYFSNHGKCVDIFAPGLNIKSIWNTGKHSVNTISGTSMASPHIAGLAAYFLSIYPEKLDLASLGVFEDEQDEFVAANGEAYDLGQYLSWNSVSSQGQLAFGKFKEVVGYGGATKSDDGSQILSTKMLKKAMIKMATSGVLSKLPGHTCNSLAYNNATLA
ncbi:hypothetical protein MJO29_005938 [Puccinia striiformis f. sp. tritici]|uniref:hypothetical protein n=1 Tax=Puccinia striiformis f. sp. tritici TaxID=168172 RepID=UPI000A123D52|nr:hypothetical protein Pst134EA_011136 [Puccinia striiformis f. sp. tritici]KAH9467493.1 hypothetical protein Pst134EA_011136 [Puccinia striiformis f. sp. tritici]KAI7957721.1 hypothetical protein MJO29_005938 [Puccinia striiformis f. sp. tritici]